MKLTKQTIKAALSHLAEKYGLELDPVQIENVSIDLKIILNAQMAFAEEMGEKEA